MTPRAFPWKHYKTTLITGRKNIILVIHVTMYMQQHRYKGMNIIINKQTLRSTIPNWHIKIKKKHNFAIIFYYKN